MEEKWKKIWDQFYSKYSRSFWFYIYKVCGDETLADDIFQESFYRIFEAKPIIQNEKHLQAYLHKVAFRLIIDQKRKIKTQRKVFEKEMEACKEDIRKKGQESKILLSLDMEKTFHRLKPRDRMLLWLAYVEGYSYEEIAALTKTKENSLKVQLFRARGKLANILKKKRHKEEVEP